MRKISYTIPPTDGWFWECPQCAASRHLSSKRQSAALSGSHWEVYRRSTLADFATVRASRYKVLMKPNIIFPLLQVSWGMVWTQRWRRAQWAGPSPQLTGSSSAWPGWCSVSPGLMLPVLTHPHLLAFYTFITIMSINICSRRSVCLLKKSFQILCVKLFVNFQFFNILPLKISL